MSFVLMPNGLALADPIERSKPVPPPRREPARTRGRRRTDQLVFGIHLRRGAQPDARPGLRPADLTCGTRTRSIRSVEFAGVEQEINMNTNLMLDKLPQTAQSTEG